MSTFRKVTDKLSVSPQMTKEDIAAAAADGFKTIICNRPDGEEPGMPLSTEIKEAAAAAGLDYVYLPFSGFPPADIIGRQRDLIDAAEAPVLAYCRSGTRSVTTWALGKTDADDRRNAVQAAANAGYDLSSLLI